MTYFGSFQAFQCNQILTKWCGKDKKALATATDVMIPISQTLVTLGFDTRSSRFTLRAFQVYVSSEWPRKWAAFHEAAILLEALARSRPKQTSTKGGDYSDLT